MFFGYGFAFGGNWPFTSKALPNTIANGESVYGAAPSNEILDAIKIVNEGAPTRNTLEQLASMFGREYPESISSEVITTNMNQWSNFWYFPMILAAAITIIFALTFWDKVKSDK